MLEHSDPLPTAVLLDMFPAPLPTVIEFIVASLSVEKLPVTPKLPVICADPVKGKVEAAPPALRAKEAVRA